MTSGAGVAFGSGQSLLAFGASAQTGEDSIAAGSFEAEGINYDGRSGTLRRSCSPPRLLYRVKLLERIAVVAVR